IDPEGRLFWRAIPYNHPQLFEDGANAHVISRLGLSAELCRAGTEVIAEQIRAKVCEPLSHVASAVVISTALDPEIVRSFVLAGFRIAGVVDERSNVVEPAWPVGRALGVDLPPAIVIGRSNPNMLAQVRALGRSGVAVHCILNRGEPASIVRASRYTASVVDLRRGGDADVIAAIKAIASSARKKPVLFYGGDFDITLIARISKAIADDVVFVTAPDRAQAMNAKTEQGTRVSAAGVRVPRGGGIRTQEDLERFCTTLQFPVIC